MSELGELKVDGWRFQCKSCGHKVGIDKPFPKTCPGCGRGGWWGHMVAQNNGKNGGGMAKTLTQKEPEGITTRNRILSQLPDAVEHGRTQNNGISEPSPGRGRGRPLQPVPEDLILELASQGFSSRAMVEELAKRGSPGIGYKTIQRRLQASLL